MQSHQCIALALFHVVLALCSESRCSLRHQPPPPLPRSDAVCGCHIPFARERNALNAYYSDLAIRCTGVCVLQCVLRDKLDAMKKSEREQSDNIDLTGFRFLIACMVMILLPFVSAPLCAFLSRIALLNPISVEIDTIRRESGENRVEGGRINNEADSFDFIVEWIPILCLLTTKSPSVTRDGKKCRGGEHLYVSGAPQIGSSCRVAGASGSDGTDSLGSNLNRRSGGKTSVCGINTSVRRCLENKEVFLAEIRARSCILCTNEQKLENSSKIATPFSLRRFLANHQGESDAEYAPKTASQKFLFERLFALALP